MGRDLRTPKTGSDRCKYYKATYVENMQLTASAKAEGVFYSTDYEPVRKQMLAGGSQRHLETTVKLETKDNVSDLSPDDYVLYNGDLYLVESVEAKDLVDEAKPYARPLTKYIIALRR